MTQSARLLLLIAAAVFLSDAGGVSSAEPDWPFFAFDNGVGRDGGWQPARQAEVTARLGYDGIGYTRVEDLNQRYAACETHGQGMLVEVAASGTRSP